LKIDRQHVQDVFGKYTDAYDSKDPKIALKIEHTYHVAEVADQVAHSLGLSQEDCDLAWILGMLHDVGRFEQVRRYGTFVDSQSIAHALMSCQVLFPEDYGVEESVFRAMPNGHFGSLSDYLMAGDGTGDDETEVGMEGCADDNKVDTALDEKLDGKHKAESDEKLDGKHKAESDEKSDGKQKVESDEKLNGKRKAESDEWRHIIKLAISVHSALRIPDDISEREAMFCNILRDADKVDIFRVNVETPLTDIINTTEEEIRTSCVTADVMPAILEHHVVPRDRKFTAADHIVSHCCLAFELVYKKSREIAVEQGYLKTLTEYVSENPETNQVMDKLREQLSLVLEAEF